MGCIAGVGGTEGQPMLMAAMIIGPFAGWVIKKFDNLMESRMPAGFEMLINNFSIGIIGMLLAILGFYVIGPFMSVILAVLTAGVAVLINNHLLPLAAIFIEPAKVLFLNNAINHGIFTPIGAEQAAQTGQSIMYMLEADPGPGLGVLLAYWAFCKDKATKDSAPGAIIIHLFGGIHEIYFPYILMNPAVIIGPIVGNICAITWFSVTGCGLKGPASPGSIIAFIAMAPKDKVFLILIGVLIATVVSFLISAPIVRMAGDKSLDDAQKKVADMKAESKGMAPAAGSAADVAAPDQVRKIIFACDAGMGSSAMGATKFRNRVKAARPDLTVKNSSVDTIPSDCDIAVVQSTLVERARTSAPQAQIVTIENFLTDPALDALYEKLTAAPATAVSFPINAAEASENKQVLIDEAGVRLHLAPVSKEEAIRAAGEMLVAQGCVEPSYIDAMLAREKVVTTYIGMGLAIPHGTADAKASVKKTGIVLTQYPEGVDFGAEKAQLVIGIAGIGDEHLELLSKIVSVLEDPEVLEKMKTTNDVQWIIDTLS
jgi:PTS system mannitol-specific IIC component